MNKNNVSSISKVPDDTVCKQLPAEPVKINLQGMHGRVVEIDPRRVRPFERNPRLPSNPGFSKESIEVLAEGIAHLGQQEDGKAIPILNHPDFDAQLVDGARRRESCISANVFFSVKVREDIDPDDNDEIYLESVVCNHGKEEHTIVELVLIVREMRAMGKTNKEIAYYIGKSEVQVSQYFQASKLNSLVIKLLAKGLTLQIALMLKNLSPKNQIKHAKKIVSGNMGVHKAKRYLMSIQRDDKYAIEIPKGRPKRGFDSLMKLLENSDDRFGLYLDMHPKEIKEMVKSVRRSDRIHAVKEIRFLASCLNDIANTVDAIDKT